MTGIPNPYGGPRPRQDPYAGQPPQAPTAWADPKPSWTTHGPSAEGLTWQQPPRHAASQAVQARGIPTSPYGRPVWQAPVRTGHPLGTTVLVLGILSCVTFPPLGIVGLVLDGRARRDIAANPERWYQSSSQGTGRVLSIVGTIFTALIASFFALVLLAASS